MRRADVVFLMSWSRTFPSVKAKMHKFRYLLSCLLGSSGASNTTCCLQNVKMKRREEKL